MAIQRNDLFPFLQIVQERGLHLLAEIDHSLIPALSAYLDAAYVKVDILEIQPHAFRYTDAGSQEQGQQRYVPYFCLFMIFQFLFGKLGAVLHLIQQDCHLIGLQAYDFLVVELWQGHKGGRIVLEHLSLVEIIVEAAQRGQLSGFSPLRVCDVLAVLLVQGHIFQIFLDIEMCQLVQNRKGEVPDFDFPAKGVLLMEIFKEQPDIVGVGQSGAGGGVFLDSPEEGLAERGKGLQHGPHLQDILFVLFVMVIMFI